MPTNAPVDITARELTAETGEYSISLEALYLRGGSGSSVMVRKIIINKVSKTVMVSYYCSIGLEGSIGLEEG